MVTEPLKKDTCEFSVLFSMAAIVFSKATQKCESWLWNDFILAKTYSKLCVFGQNVFFLGIAGKKQSFLPKKGDLQGLRHSDFQVFGSKWPQISTTYLSVDKILMEH